ncbi:MAG: arginine deiminase-related protein [Bacteroidia bacterium]|nr:arginine deiminase-related protein [Bacteroidia bacterium]MDW8157367.1 arginine deiminase-related protein [Bacteroidia bacterium]
MEDMQFTENKNSTHRTLQPQCTANILLIRPANFGFNEQTAGTNAFQSNADFNGNAKLIHLAALQEFEGLQRVLEANHVDTLVIEDTPTPVKPCALFPNNWITTHIDGTIVLYPMFALNRREEVRRDIVEMLKQKYQVYQVWDYTSWANDNIFLEGTGSLVLDRPNYIAYACLSPRTHLILLQTWAQKMGYELISFEATDPLGQPIYHTNVMMSVGEHFAVIVVDSITDIFDRNKVIQKLEATGKEIIPLTFEQMRSFAGNLLEIKNRFNEHLIVLSEQALKSLNNTQIKTLARYGKLITAPLYTIEKFGGGSARCMLAEIHLLPK